VVHADPLAFQQQLQAPPAKPPTLGCELLQPRPCRCIVGSDMPCSRHTSDTFIPASCSRRTPMICSSLNRLRFIVRLPLGSRTLPKPGGVFGAQVTPNVSMDNMHHTYPSAEYRG